MVRSNLISSLTIGLLSAALSQAQEDAQSDRWDVVVLGGGSTGTYSAIRLRQQGLNVALIEKSDRLGGHVDTYVDPNSNATYDYGVQLFTNSSIVRDYFEYFDIPLVSVDLNTGSLSRLNIDFKTGSSLNSSTLISSNVIALATGLLGYKSEIQKHPDIVSSWNLTYPVSEDLLIPFGDFLQKYNLEGAAFPAFSYAAGCGNILKQPTLYVMKYFSEIQVDAVIGSGFIANGLSNNQELYDRALSELAETAFLSSNVYNITRDDAGVEVHMYTPTGPKRIKARKLLITIPPKLENLSPFLDLDTNEQAIFGQLNNTYYWDILVKNTGLPANASVNNIDPSAALQIPAMPAVYNLNAVASIPGLHATYYGSATPLTEGQVKADVTATIERIRTSLGYPAPAENLEFVGFNSHAPFVLTVPTDAIQAGFYQKLLALQGEKDTWFTGATWLNQASGELWEYTEAMVLPGLVKSLGLSSLIPLAEAGTTTVNVTSLDTSNITESKDHGKEYVAPAEYGQVKKKAASFLGGFKFWA